MSIVKVAFAQIDFKPAFFLNEIDMLVEPHGDTSTTISKFSFPGSQNLKSSLKSEYISWIKSLVINIVKHAVKLNVDLLVFPEYSIPVDLLSDIVTVLNNSNTTVVAGTHIVTKSANIPSDYPTTKNILGCAMCPILSKDGLIGYTFKTNKANPELYSLKTPNVPVNDIFDFGKFSIQVKICIDAIHGGNVYTFSENKKGILVIPSWSKNTEPFKAVSIYSKFNEIPVVYANCAAVGGSQISGAFSVFNNHWLADKSNTKPIPRNSECLVSAVLDIDRMYETKGTTDLIVSSDICDVVNIYYSRSIQQQQLMYKIDKFLNDIDNSARLQEIKQSKIDIITSEKVKYLEQMHQNGLLNDEMVQNTLSYIKINNIDLQQFMRLQDKRIFDNLCGNMKNATTDPIFYVNMATVSTNMANIGTQRDNSEIISDDDNLFYGRDRDIIEIHNFLYNNENILLIHGLRGTGKTKLLKKIESLAIPQPSPWEIYTIHLYKDIGFQSFLDELLFTLGAPYIEQNGKDVSTIVDALFDFLNLKTAVIIILDDVNYLIDHSGDFIDSRVKSFLTKMVINVKLSHCVKLIISSNRRIDSLERMGLKIHEITKLDDNTIRAIISYCYGKITNSVATITIRDEAVRQIYGNPLASILVAQLLVENAQLDIESNTDVFLKFQEQIIKNLLSGVNLSSDEEAIMSILSVAKGSIPIDFIKSNCLFLLPSVERLKKRFLVEFDEKEDTINTHPLFKEYYYNLLKPEERNQYHKMYADFYEYSLSSRDQQKKTIRPFILSNAIYHYAGSGQISKLFRYKKKYIEEVKPVADRLFKDKSYDTALKYYRMIYDTIGDERKDIFIKMAQCYVYNKDINNADKFFELVTKFNQRGAYLWAQYSIALSSIREYTPRSIECAEMAEKVYNEFGNSYPWELALIKFAQAKSQRYVSKDKCLRLYDEACTLDPTSPYYLCMYTAYLLYCGNKKLAIEKLKQAETIDSTYDFLQRLKQKVYNQFEISAEEISEIAEEDEDDLIDVESSDIINI